MRELGESAARRQREQSEHDEEERDTPHGSVFHEHAIGRTASRPRLCNSAIDRNMLCIRSPAGHEGTD
jgi:hypothetical protein